MNNPGRNDPCHCGSGKKYKKCCLPLEQPTRTSDPPREEPFIAELRPDLDEAVDRALQRLARGEGKQVESEIAELLEDNPDYHMTNYAMGVYQAVVAKKPAAAIPFFEKAVAIFPPFAEAHFNLGNAARQAFDIPKAVDAYRAAERYSQDDGIAEMARKELQWLERTLLQSTSFRSLDAYVANARLFDRAFQCLNNRQFDVAVELFHRVLSENPKHVQSYGNLALAYAGVVRRRKDPVRAAALVASAGIGRQKVATPSSCRRQPFDRAFDSIRRLHDRILPFGLRAGNLGLMLPPAQKAEAAAVGRASRRKLRLSSVNLSPASK